MNTIGAMRVPRSGTLVAVFIRGDEMTRKVFNAYVDYRYPSIAPRMRKILDYIICEHFHSWLQQEIKMPNLFPDMSRERYEGSEDFIFGAPIDIEPWRKLLELADKAKNKSKTPYIRLPEGAFSADMDITILLRRDFETDDDMLEAAAWLRVVKNTRDRIYAVPSYESMDLCTAMTKTIGAPRHLSVMFDVPEKEVVK